MFGIWKLTNVKKIDKYVDSPNCKIPKISEIVRFRKLVNFQILKNYQIQHSTFYI